MPEVLYLQKEYGVGEVSIKTQIKEEVRKLKPPDKYKYSNNRIILRDYSFKKFKNIVEEKRKKKKKNKEDSGKKCKSISRNRIVDKKSPHQIKNLRAKSQNIIRRSAKKRSKSISTKKPQKQSNKSIKKDKGIISKSKSQRVIKIEKKSKSNLKTKVKKREKKNDEEIKKLELSRMKESKHTKEKSLKKEKEIKKSKTGGLGRKLRQKLKDKAIMNYYDIINEQEAKRKQLEQKFKDKNQKDIENQSEIIEKIKFQINKDVQNKQKNIFDSENQFIFSGISEQMVDENILKSEHISGIKEYPSLKEIKENYSKKDKGNEFKKEKVKKDENNLSYTSKNKIDYVNENTKIDKNIDLTCQQIKNSNKREKSTKEYINKSPKKQEIKLAQNEKMVKKYINKNCIESSLEKKIKIKEIDNLIPQNFNSEQIKKIEQKYDDHFSYYINKHKSNFSYLAKTNQLKESSGTKEEKKSYKIQDFRKVRDEHKSRIMESSLLGQKDSKVIRSMSPSQFVEEYFKKDQNKG